MTDIAERFNRAQERKNRAIGKQRIGDLNKIFAHRYGGAREDYVFPDDDAGLEDLKILLHHYALNNPLAIPRIIKNRASWAGSEKLQEEIFTYPRKWRADTLGRILRLTAGEWRVLRLRTIAPIDMIREERRRDSQVRNRDRQCFKRRRAGMKPRQEWEAASLSRTKPWERLGMSRRDWYRKGKPEALAQVCSNKDNKAATHLCQNSEPTEGQRKGCPSKHPAATLQPETQAQV
jgi:hypothetical protein